MLSKAKETAFVDTSSSCYSLYTSLSPLLQAEKVWGFFSNKVDWSPINYGSCFFSVVLIMRSLSLELLEIICLCSLWSVMLRFLTHSVRTSAVTWPQTSSSIFNRPYFYSSRCRFHSKSTFLLVSLVWSFNLVDLSVGNDIFCLVCILGLPLENQHAGYFNTSLWSMLWVAFSASCTVKTKVFHFHPLRVPYLSWTPRSSRVLNEYDAVHN